MTARRRRRHHRFRRSRWSALFLIVIVIALVIADRQGWLLVEPAGAMGQYHGRTFQVVRIIDGDTIEIEAFDPEEQRPTTRVRLWGINCPETAGQSSPIAEPWADEATKLTAALIENSSVTLRLEPSRLRGRYGRILAHVETADGKLLNELLLEAGLAKADERWPHSALRRYAEAQRRAQDADLGVWSQ